MAVIIPNAEDLRNEAMDSVILEIVSLCKHEARCGNLKAEFKSSALVGIFGKLMTVSMYDSIKVRFGLAGYKVTFSNDEMVSPSYFDTFKILTIEWA